MTAANAMDRGVPGAGGQGSETRPVPVGRAADEAPAPEVVAPDVVAREVVAREVVAREGAAPEVSEAPASRREWLTIHEASDLIGVSPATLRRWSDAGEIRAFTTPASRLPAEG